MSTSAVDTWRTVKIYTENLIEVSNGFYPTQVPPMIQMKVQVLNLKTLKTQVQIEYLTREMIKTLTLHNNDTTLKAEWSGAHPHVRDCCTVVVLVLYKNQISHINLTPLCLRVVPLLCSVSVRITPHLTKQRGSKNKFYWTEIYLFIYFMQIQVHKLIYDEEICKLSRRRPKNIIKKKFTGPLDRILVLAYSSNTIK